jgi:hypothetical protein
VRLGILESRRAPGKNTTLLVTQIMQQQRLIEQNDEIIALLKKQAEK